MKKEVLLFLCCLLIGFASATCTVTLDKESYNQKETITAQMTCSEVAEKNDDYNLTWTNETGAILEIDSGTTPSQVDANFFQTYIIPSDYVSSNGVNITATLTGGDTEGSDYANITTASSSSLIITNIETTSEILIGKQVSIKASIIDENNKEIDNALCRIKVLDENSKPVNTLDSEISINGEISFSTVVSSKSLDEGREYVFAIDCTCGLSNTSVGCYDEDGISISPSTGGLQYPFSMGTWLTMNTVTDKSSYNIIDRMRICVNVTNPDTRDRQELWITYGYRCDGDDSGTNRIVIDTSSEMRAISGNLTQMQCRDFLIPIDSIIEQGATECYASTDVKALDKAGDTLIIYHTTSPEFTVNINSIHPEAEWNRVNRTNYYANITYEDWDIGVKNIHTIVKSASLGGFVNLEDVKSYSIYYTNGSKFTGDTGIFHHRHPVRTSSIDVGNGIVLGEDFEIAIEGVNTSLNENFTIYLEIVDFENRQANALEGIENKTGTFEFSITAKNTPTPDTVNFEVYALLEISDKDEVEGFFNCYIEGYKEETEIQFNKAINKITPYQDTRNLNIPSGLTGIQTIVCDLGFLGFGNDKDTASDTFKIGVGGEVVLPEVEEEKTIIEKIKEATSKLVEEVKDNKVYWIVLVCVAVCLIFVCFWKEKEEGCEE